MRQINKILIVGFGASSLNVRALISSIPQTLVPFYYLDTLDALSVKEILSKLDFSTTAVFIISKSGNTQETNLLTKYLVAYPIKNLSILCDNQNSELYNIVKKIDHKWIDYAKIKSGRFALLTQPFLQIAAIAGVDANKIEKGASLMSEEEVQITADKWITNFKSGKANWVVMLYSRQIYGLFLWIRQIISESLGKENFGIFPILVEGTMDEHSQLQLFLDGPDDKFYDIISAGSNIKEFEELALSQTDHAYKIANMLKSKNRIVSHSHHDFINEIVVGKYIATYIRIVEAIAEKVGLDPHTQPAVESMKQKSYENRS